MHTSYEHLCYYNQFYITKFQKWELEFGNCSEGNLRLMDGSDLVGRLEICMNNAWGTICDTWFWSSELEVACTQLGGLGTAVMHAGVIKII